jgi:integrase
VLGLASTSENANCATIGEAARSLGPSMLLFFQLAHETGHRGNAIRQLRWSDVDFERGLLLFRADADKIENEHQVPLALELIDRLQLVRRNTGRIGDGWVFPDPANASQPMSRYLVIEWWKKLEDTSGLRRIRGRGWHSLRRTFANDLNKAGVSLSDAAKLGGWSGPKTLTTVYLDPDEEALRAAMTKLSSLRAAG